MERSREEGGPDRMTTDLTVESPRPVRSPARDELIRLQKALFKQQRALIGDRVKGYSPAFKAYEASYQRRVRTFERVAEFREVVHAAVGSDIVHVGDYHTLKQAQRWYLKLVRRMRESGRNVVLALEFVEARHQDALDQYLAGRISEEALLDQTGLDRRSGFDVWPNFRPIFEFAREHRLPIVGIERSGTASLGVRDRFFARAIVKAARRHRGSAVVVLAGQLHCATPHLPKEVARAFGKSQAPKQLIVYQNAESVWFELERQGLEHDTEAVRIGPAEFCLVNTSPLVAQQSFLDWVEDGELVETTQPERHFKRLARMIAQFMGLRAGAALDEVQVYTAGDLSFLQRLRETGVFNRRELAQIRRQILARESYYIPKARIAYLGGLSMNHAAEEAAHFLRHVATGDMTPERGLIDDFYARTLEEAFAFFGSKIVNPRRKAAHPEDLAHRLHSSDPAERRLAKAALAHLAMERGDGGRAFQRAFNNADPRLVADLTHVLGYIVGDRLYYGLVQGEISRAEARRLFRDPMLGEGAACALYFALGRRFAEVRVPHRS